MLDKSIRVLNFDNSVIRQSVLLNRYRAEVIDFTGFSSSARLYLQGELRGKITNSLKYQSLNYPTFLGSGDFHHISEILTSQIKEPACLVIFDYHPDWDVLPPRYGCGSWVRQALRNKNILKCILIGMGSQDLSFPGIQTGDLSALSGNHLEIYPYRHKPSRVYFRRIPKNNSITVDQGLFSNKIIWHQLENEDLDEFILKLIKRLPTQRVYISIDKDCLNREFAFTNWEEGYLRLEQLLLMLKLLRKNLDIIGLDVSGDYSVPLINSRLKSFFSRLDHPKTSVIKDFPADLILKINQQANLEILREIFS